MQESATTAVEDPFAHQGRVAITQGELFGRQYPQHLQELERRLADQLAACGHDSLVLTAGSADNHLFDDQPSSFRANPHLRQWLPFDDCAGAALLLEPGRQPELLFLQPSDYWHQPPQLPPWAAEHLQVSTFTTQALLQNALEQRIQGRNGVAMIGATRDHLIEQGHQSNPAALLAMMDYDRAQKTAFEQNCMRLATRRAVAGHRAAAQAFEAGVDAGGATEFEIHCDYLRASQQTESDLPYGNIVALNSHAAVLHYQHQDRRRETPTLSLLIDAGARCHGYASDITRTYSHGPGLFQDLIAALNAEQLQLIDSIAVGQNYLALHQQMHHRIAKILCDSGILRCGADEAFEQHLTEPFLPHGLGHLIGLQTHDVAGQADRSGHTVPPPPEYAALRLTRPIEENQVFTIEPGIYFIPMLLEPLLAGPQGHLVNAEVLSSLREFGGIRIEDNVLVSASGVDNFTRESFAEQATQA
ncbi:MAG: Xaa-Pro dipeptidase [Pseudomonadales bacterium]